MELERPGNTPNRTSAHRALMERIRARDESALASLFDATSPRVHGLARRILASREAADETTCDVYLHVWRNAASWDPDRGSVESWLLTLARSRAIDRLRATARTDRREAPLDEEVHSREDASPDPESASLLKEESSRVRRALAGLSPPQRRAIEASFYGGLSYTEVARWMGAPEGTVKTWIRSGLASLRIALGSEERRSA